MGGIGKIVGGVLGTGGSTPKIRAPAFRGINRKRNAAFSANRRRLAPVLLDVWPALANYRDGPTLYLIGRAGFLTRRRH
jgi:hypothetical protein